MNKPLRKTSTLVHISYSNGNYTNNLFAENIYLDTQKGVISIDLAGNLRVKNKETNTYVDAMEFVEDEQQTSLIEIDDEQVVKNFVLHTNKLENLPSQVRICIDAEKDIIKSIDPEIHRESLLLKIN